MFRHPRATALFALAATLTFTIACHESRSRDGDTAPDVDASTPIDAAVPSGSPPERRRRLAASSVHACAVRRSGLFCWGQDLFGELGTGEVADSTEPVPAPEAGTDIAEVAVHTGRTCIRRSTGEVACWGANESGQIGDGTRDSARVPIAVHGLDDAVQIALDDTATCALHATGRVSCWGGSPSDASTPTLMPAEIEGLTGVVEIRDGHMGRFCARTRDETVSCWTVANGVWSAPTPVAALSGARSFVMTFNDILCAIVAEGEIACHNLDNGFVGRLGSSKGSVEIVNGLLSAAARNEAGDWSMWNVLPPMLESVGSEAIPILTDIQFVELVIGGFNICAIRKDDAVACANANAGFDLHPIALPE